MGMAGLWMHGAQSLLRQRAAGLVPLVTHACVAGPLGPRTQVCAQCLISPHYHHLQHTASISRGPQPPHSMLSTDCVCQRACRIS